jgi:CRISPR-associated protein Csb2
VTSGGLSIVVRLRDGRYDAGGLDPGVPEWPPHPARIFCGLLAGATDESDHSALSWLERQGAPEILASADVVRSRVSGFVVTNKVEGSASQTWPARTNGVRSRVGALPGDDTFAVVWPEAHPDDGTLARLVRLASRLPYVGRTTSHAEVTVIPTAVATRLGWSRYRPVPMGTAGAVAVRVPFPGYLQALTIAFSQDERAWQVPAVTLAYSSRHEEPQSPDRLQVIDSPYADVLVWGFARRMVPIPGDWSLHVAGCLRKAVLQRVPDPLPAQVTGHGANGRPHVAYLSLVDVNHDHADGHILGVGVAIPNDMSAVDRKSVLRGILGRSATETMDQLTVWRGRSIELDYAPDGSRGLRPQRWQCPQGSLSWVTATPLMLDRFPKSKDDTSVAEAMGQSLITAGYPSPSRVDLLAGPAVVGGVTRLKTDSLGARRGRPMRHCRVTFDRPQRGPILAGASRYLGGGLFVPEEDRDVDA